MSENDSEHPLPPLSKSRRLVRAILIAVGAVMCLMAIAIGLAYFGVVGNGPAPSVAVQPEAVSVPPTRAPSGIASKWTYRQEKNPMNDVVTSIAGTTAIATDQTAWVLMLSCVQLPASDSPTHHDETQVALGAGSDHRISPILGATFIRVDGAPQESISVVGSNPEQFRFIRTALSDDGLNLPLLSRVFSAQTLVIQDESDPTGKVGTGPVVQFHVEGLAEQVKKFPEPCQVKIAEALRASPAEDAKPADAAVTAAPEQAPAVDASGDEPCGPVASAVACDYSFFGVKLGDSLDSVAGRHPKYTCDTIRESGAFQGDLLCKGIESLDNPTGGAFQWEQTFLFSNHDEKTTPALILILALPKNQESDLFLLAEIALHFGRDETGIALGHPRKKVETPVGYIAHAPEGWSIGAGRP